MKRIVLLALMVLFVSSVAHAAVVREDIYYWCVNQEQQQYASMSNPSDAWLAEHMSDIVIKVQQTVYDLNQTMSLISRENIVLANPISTTNPGYLYEYAVSNKNWPHPITAFGVNWGSVTPMWIGTGGAAKSDGWTGAHVYVDATHAGPIWTAASTPILDMQSLGSFYAIANTSHDVEAEAFAGSGTMIYDNGLGGVFITGKTSAPSTPEPGSLLAMASGLIGLGVLKRRRK